MKKLLVILALVLAYTCSYAEDYAPDQKGYNWDDASVTLTATMIDPIEASILGIEGLNDIIVGTIRTWGDDGPGGTVEIKAAAGYEYIVTFGNEFTAATNPVKVWGKWFDGTTELTSPATLSGNKELDFFVTKADATGPTVVPGLAIVTVSVSIQYAAL